MLRLIVLIPVLTFALCGCESEDSPADPGGGLKGNAVAGEALAKARCFTVPCHVKGSVMKAPLFEDMVPARVETMARYPEVIAALKVKDRPRYDASQGIIEEILAETDPDRKLELWLRTYLKQTTFDDGGNKMLPLPEPLTEQELSHVVAYLFTLK